MSDNPKIAANEALAGQNACKVLHEIVCNQNVKLDLGMRKRAEILGKISKGEAICNYRTEWASSVVRKMFNLFAMECQSFNERFPHDKASNYDLWDILNTSIERLKSGG